MCVSHSQTCAYGQGIHSHTSTYKHIHGLGPNLSQGMPSTRTRSASYGSSIASIIIYTYLYSHAGSTLRSSSPLLSMSALLTPSISVPRCPCSPSRSLGFLVSSLVLCGIYGILFESILLDFTKFPFFLKCAHHVDVQQPL